MLRAGESGEWGGSKVKAGLHPSVSPLRKLQYV